MRIDFILSNFGGDGAQRVVCSLANYFAEKGNIVRIITYRDGDKYRLNENVERIRLHKKLPLFDTNLTRAAVHLFRFYWKKKNRPDVISSHINTMGLVSIPISLLYNIKLVVSEHNNYLAAKMSAKQWFLWNVLYKFPQAVTILTRFDKTYFEKKNKNVRIMPNPLSFEPKRNVAVRDNKTIVAAGNLDRYHHKGFDNLIEIAAKVVQKHSDWKFMIIGSGDQGLAFLKQKAESLGVSNSMIFAGYRSDVQDIMQTSEIFMLSSRFEGLPMVLLEAASQGIACISYDCISGPSEIIEDGVSGILVEDQNKDEMVQQTLALIADENLRKKLGTNAVNYVEKFSCDKIGLKWQQLFDEILKT